MKKGEETLKLFLLSFDLSFLCCFPCSPTRLLSLSPEEESFLLSGPCMRCHPVEITLCPVFPAHFSRPCICDYPSLARFHQQHQTPSVEQTPLETCDVAIGHVAQTPSLTSAASPAISGHNPSPHLLDCRDSLHTIQYIRTRGMKAGLDLVFPRCGICKVPCAHPPARQ